MEAHGVRFQPSLSGALSLARTNALFLGGGKALVNAHYRTAQKLGVDVRDEATMTHLGFEEARISEVEHKQDGATHRIMARFVVVAAGGFQAGVGWPAPP